MKIEKRFCFNSLNIKAEGERTIVGIASTFEAPENHDSYGDVIARGAFLESLEKVKSGERKIKMLDSHGAPIGLWTTLEETEKGLRVEGRVSKVPDGDAVLELVKDGVTDGLSIGFSYGGSKSRELDVYTKWGYPVTEWTMVDLREVSPTPFPANEFAKITEVRDARSLKHSESVSASELGPLLDEIIIRDAALAASIYESQIKALEALTRDV